MGARWYDGQLGRWSSPDSIVPNPANPQSYNRYSYTRNNPVKFRDPSGHMEIYGGNPHQPYSAYWYTYANPQAPGCQHDLNWVDQTASLAVDFTPIVGDAKGLVEVATGKDLFTGEDLGAWRWLGLVGLSEARNLRHLRYAGEVLEFGIPIGRVLRDGKWVELGSWVSHGMGMSDEARAYQQFITGAEAGFEFLRNGVHFDGIRLSPTGEAILLDAKSGADFSKVGGEPFVKEIVLKEARRQLGAAGGLMIQWHVQDNATSEALQALFMQEGIAIDVVWTKGP
jgi:hypothetical protein